MLFSLMSTTCSTRGLALEDLARHRLADRAGAADDQKPPLGHPRRQLGLVPRDIRIEQRLITADQFQNIHRAGSLNRCRRRWLWGDFESPDLSRDCSPIAIVAKPQRPGIDALQNARWPRRVDKRSASTKQTIHSQSIPLIPSGSQEPHDSSYQPSATAFLKDDHGQSPGPVANPCLTGCNGCNPYAGTNPPRREWYVPRNDAAKPCSRYADWLRSKCDGSGFFDSRQREE